MKKIKIQELTEENFAPFGKVLTTKDRPYGGAEGVYKWYEKQAQIDDAHTVSVNLLTAIHRDMVCSLFESHQKTEEVILPLTGGIIVAGIPEDAPYPLDEEVTCAVIFRHGTGQDDAVMHELEEITLEL